MRADFLHELICPTCRFETLVLANVDGVSNIDWIETDVLLCTNCNSWYPIVSGIPILLAEVDLYREIRDKYYNDYAAYLDLHPDKSGAVSTDADKKQVEHYSKDAEVYDDLVTNNTFWRAFDWNTVRGWFEEIRSEHVTLDLGCGTGHCTIPLAQKKRKVVSFDLSLSMVLKARNKCIELQLEDMPDFFVGNACNIPLKPQIFHNVIAFGVLHHVHDPLKTIQESARILKAGGAFYGLENNASFFRPVFDFVMRWKTLWNEEAGSHPCLHKCDIQQWAAMAGMISTIKTSTFLLPHFFNFFSLAHAKTILAASDRFFCRAPILKDQGGLLLLKLTKEC